ncbi:hypothetical protein DN820_17575 [Stutzerimonas nosocomialis]|uniref:Transglycosylase SLT domain-containing protein n=1 Tax=Stutzerimonas nosocomialis TaxID=1056496 RepID=A0A5R9QAM7_9GAMM|nr:transglycosylase SLT domain-containing protein [Stutzerimonas nosocomialis]TLX62141.1 hypothetical protein DN820_17575 [Stutzerimonas nosocomialis]
MNNDQYTKIKASGAPFDSLILSASNAHGVSYDLLHKQIFLESSFNPNAVSPTGPRGLGQFTKATGKAYGLERDEDFFDPAKSIDAAARHMKDNLKLAGGDELKALLAYNQGAGRLGKPQLDAYDRGDFSAISDEGLKYMQKLADVAKTGRRDELSSFAKTGSGFEAPAGLEPKPSVEPGTTPFLGASMQMDGQDDAPKAEPFGKLLNDTTGSPEGTDKGTFEGTLDAAKNELKLSPIGMMLRAAAQSDEMDFTKTYTMVKDVFNDPFEGGRLSDWTDEDYDKLRTSGLDPQFYDVVLRGYRANFDENLSMALENERMVKENAGLGLGAQVVGGATGMIGDPWTLVNPGRGAGANLGARLMGGAVAGGLVGGASEHTQAKMSGREEHLGMAIAGGAAFGGVLNGLLGPRPGRTLSELMENSTPDPMVGTAKRLEAREKARLDGLEEDPTSMPYREGDEVKDTGSAPYTDVPFDEGAARTLNGSVHSGGSPINPKTIEAFKELDPFDTKAAGGFNLGSLSEIGYKLARSGNEEIRGVAFDLFRSPTGYQTGANGKFGATASDIVERLRAQDHIAYNQMRGTLDEILKDPYWRGQGGSGAAKMEQISRRVVEAMESTSGKGHKLTPGEQKMVEQLREHMSQKWDYIENPGQFGNMNAKSLLEETRHAGSYYPQRYNTLSKQMLTEKLGGADGLQEAISRSWLASYAKRPEVRARVDKMVEEKLIRDGIEKPTPEQIKQAVEKYAKDKAYGISHTDQFNRSSLIEEHLKDGVGVENNAYLEARNLFDSDVQINLPDGSMFSVNDLREFDILRVVPSTTEESTGTWALWAAQGRPRRNSRISPPSSSRTHSEATRQSRLRPCWMP